ncbi:MAG: hypothetical protein IKE92_06780 [Clostridiales bacterium]|nr:hypothetical protein [Clostridiales bacterium]
MSRIRRKLITIILTVVYVFTLFPALESVADRLESGTCGDDLTWTLDDKGKLTISGSGDMYDWKKLNTVPWADYRDDIVSVEFDGDVTSIGYQAFSMCTNLNSVSIPYGVTSI